MLCLLCLSSSCSSSLLPSRLAASLSPSLLGISVMRRGGGRPASKVSVLAPSREPCSMPKGPSQASKSWLAATAAGLTRWTSCSQISHLLARKRLLHPVQGDSVTWSENKDAPAKRLCGFVPAAGALEPCIVGSPGAGQGLSVPYFLFCLGAQFAVLSVMAGS
jgi:hypothetical protein